MSRLKCIVILGAWIACCSVAVPIRSCAKDKTNVPPLLITRVTKTNDVFLPSTNTVALAAVIVATPITNVVQAGNGDTIVVMTQILARCILTAPHDGMVLQFNYDKPLATTTNVYRLQK